MPKTVRNVRVMEYVRMHVNICIALCVIWDTPDLKLVKRIINSV